MKKNILLSFILIILCLSFSSAIIYSSFFIKKEWNKLPNNSIPLEKIKTTLLTNKTTQQENLILSDKQKIEMLRNEAKKDNVHWRIYCTGLNGNWKYKAEAHQTGSNIESIYAEDGAKDWWVGDGPTQADSAFELYKYLKAGPPNHLVDHKKAEIKCNSVITDKTPEVLCIPCK